MTKLSTVRFHLKVPTSEEESSKEEACLTKTVALCGIFMLKFHFLKIAQSCVLV